MLGVSAGVARMSSGMPGTVRGRFGGVVGIAHRENEVAGQTGGGRWEETGWVSRAQVAVRTHWEGFLGTSFHSNPK